MLPKQKEKLTRLFNQLYPNPKSELNFKNQYQLLVSVILSAQCTDKKVNQITPQLFEKYPSFKELSKAPLDILETIIKPINYYKTKAKNLKEMAITVSTKMGSRLPKTHTALVSLPGVGNKTANVILAELGTIPAFPVDTHVFRVSKRLGLASEDTVDKVEIELKAQFKAELWHNMHHWLIFHGRRVCKARKPLCHDCSISSLCPSRV